MLCILLCAAQLPAQAASSAAPAQQSATALAQPASTKQKITPAQAKQLFALVDELIGFASEQSGLPVKAKVKRKLITRAQVQSYLRQKLAEDKNAQHLAEEELVLQKFGLLGRDFHMRSFLIDLLTEQIEAFYDTHTQTVNLLDWVTADEQRPVLAHELTHALQDQRVGLEKWGDQGSLAVSHTVAEDVRQLDTDEADTAREAVTEGQATAVMTNYVLKPLGKSIVTNPELVLQLQSQMHSSEDSPVMGRAPFLLSELMLFPYRDGLSFVQDVWMDKGQTAAFATLLDKPPSTTWQVLNPRPFEQGLQPPAPLFPNVHPLTERQFAPYDIGRMGQLDVHILAKLYGGDRADQILTPAWNGGFYWAGQQRTASAAAKSTTASLALFYFSSWSSPATAQYFARLYAQNLGRIFTQVQEQGQDPVADNASNERIFTTSEGPVLISVRKNQVFVSESFPLPMARELARLSFDSQPTGQLQQATRIPSETRLSATKTPAPQTLPTLTSGLSHLFAQSGVMKVGVPASVRIRNTCTDRESRSQIPAEGAIPPSLPATPQPDCLPGR